MAPPLSRTSKMGSLNASGGTDTVSRTEWGINFSAGLATNYLQMRLSPPRVQNMMDERLKRFEVGNSFVHKNRQKRGAMIPHYYALGKNSPIFFGSISLTFVLRFLGFRLVFVAGSNSVKRNTKASPGSFVSFFANCPTVTERSESLRTPRERKIMFPSTDPVKNGKQEN